MKRKLVLPGAVLLLILLYACDPVTENWPQFRGNNCSGIAAENAKPPIEFNDQNLLWKTELPAGHSSPCIWGDNIFLTGCVEDEKKLMMYCIDRLDGKIKWQDSLSVENFERVHAIGNAAQPTATTDGERVYFYFGSYGLLCYDTSGQLLWERKFPLTGTNFGVASSPILHDEKLILCRDVSIDKKLYALNKYNGDSIWVVELIERPEKFDRYPSYSTPVIWQDNIIMHRSMQASAYYLVDGSPAWWTTLPSNGTSTPVVSEENIYFGAWHEFSEEEQRGEFPDFNTMITKYDSDKDRKIMIEEIPEDMLMFDRPELSETVQPRWNFRKFFWQLDPNGDGLSDSIEWTDARSLWRSFYVDGGLIALKPDSTGELLPSAMNWKVKEKVPEVPSPLYYKGLVFMCKNGGILTCMDALDGTVYYQERIGATGGYMASPVAANGYVYFSSMNGIVTVIKAGKQLEIVNQNDLDDRIYATPAIIKNEIYFRTANHIVAYKK